MVWQNLDIRIRLLKTLWEICDVRASTAFVRVLIAPTRRLIVLSARYTRVLLTALDVAFGWFAVASVWLVVTT